MLLKITRESQTTTSTTVVLGSDSCTTAEIVLADAHVLDLSINVVHDPRQHTVGLSATRFTVAQPAIMTLTMKWTVLQSSEQMGDASVSPALLAQPQLPPDRHSSECRGWPITAVRQRSASPASSRTLSVSCPPPAVLPPAVYVEHAASASASRLQTLDGAGLQPLSRCTHPIMLHRGPGSPGVTNVGHFSRVLPACCHCGRPPSHGLGSLAVEHVSHGAVQDVQGLSDFALLHVQRRQEAHRLACACARSAFAWCVSVSASSESALCSGGGRHTVIPSATVQRALKSVTKRQAHLVS